MAISYIQEKPSAKASLVFLILGIPFHKGLACKTKTTNRLFQGRNTTWFIVFPVSSFDTEDPFGFLI